MDYVVKEWDKKILTTIIGAGIDFNEAADVRNNIYLNMVHRKFCEKYDPERAEFSTYIYKFLQSLIKNYYRDRCTKKRGCGKITHVGISADGVYYKGSEEVDASRGRIPGHTIPFTDPYKQPLMKEAEEVFIVDKIIKDLNKYHFPRVFGDKTNKTVKSIICLILKGYTVREVSQILHVERHRVKTALKGLQNLKWLKDINKW